MADRPEGIDPGRHGDPGAPGAEQGFRWVFLTLLAALIVAALLNVFGQAGTTSTATSRAASLSVTAPTRIRGGLLYQTRIRVHALAAIKQPELVMDQGWFDQTTINAIEPQPTSENSDEGRIKLAFPALDAGRDLLVFIYFQTNPTNIGSHDQGVILQDGPAKLAAVTRSQFNFP